MTRPSLLSDLANATQIVLSLLLLTLCGAIAGDCLLQPPAPYCSARSLGPLSEHVP
jgi:hypothetical protein